MDDPHGSDVSLTILTKERKRYIRVKGGKRMVEVEIENITPFDLKTEEESRNQEIRIVTRG